MDDSPTQSISPPQSSHPANTTPEPLALPPPHLHHISWEEFEHFEPPPDTRVEVIDGFVVYQTEMTSPKHAVVVTNSGIALQLTLPGFVICFACVVQVPPCLTARRLRVSRPSYRLPDMIFDKEPSALPPSDPQDNGSPTTSGSTSPNSTPTAIKRRNQHLVNAVAQQRMTFSLEKPPFAVAEITSPSTRIVDLEEKWLCFAAAGIEFYFIFDLVSPDGRYRVIVGSLARRSGFHRSATGDPSKRPTVPEVPDDAYGEKTVYYYRRVYEENEEVTCKILGALGMTPKQMMGGDDLKTFMVAAMQRIHLSENHQSQWRSNITQRLQGHEEQEANMQAAYNQDIEEALAAGRRAAAQREKALKETIDKANKDKDDLKKKLAEKEQELLELRRQGLGESRSGSDGGNERRGISRRRSKQVVRGTGPGESSKRGRRDR